MKNNKIITIQEMLMREMQRLDDSDYMAKAGKDEVLRSNALTNNATAFIKAVNVQLRIKEVAQTNEVTQQSLSKELGINEE
jgi:hypothetical protein